jgi:uncharacterized membrane-anchored protein
MKQRKNGLTSYVERTESLMNNFLKRKRESIQKSMIRPLYQEALKSLFLVVVLFVDALIPLEIYLDLPNIINIVLTLVILSIFLYVEIRIYNLLWGKKGCWSLEKYKKTLEKNKEDTISL